MKNIEVSIVIPIYNVEHYIAKTIESVQHQDFELYEIILVDDGSRDNSGVICDQYALNDSRIVVIHQANGGVMSARFAGVGAARGKYIAFLDGDDRMPPSALSCLYKAMIENDVDYVAGVCIDIDVDGHRLNDIVYGPHFKGILSGNRLYRSFIAKNPKGMNMKLYKKELLVKEPQIKIPPFIKNNEDFIFNLFLASKIHKVLAIDDIVAHIVERPGSASRGTYDVNYWLKLFTWMDENYKNYDIYDDDYIQYKLFIIFVKLIRPCQNFDIRNSCFDNVRKTAYKKKFGRNCLFSMFVIKHPILIYPLKLIRYVYKRWKKIRTLLANKT